jgi:hypothetical protein
VTIYQSILGSLLENFDEAMAYVDHEIASDDGMDPGLADCLERDGLIKKTIQHKQLQYYEATPLGLRVIEAALRAANEVMGKHQAQLERKEREAKIPPGCTCQGAGWVWRHELPDWDGEPDDTQYDCPMCREREEATENEELTK